MLTGAINGMRLCVRDVAETKLTEDGTYVGLTTPAPGTTDGVTVTVAAATISTYCLQGVHAKNTADVWSLKPGGGATGLTKAPC